MLKSSQAFSNFEELKENVDGNRIQTIRFPVDMENNNPVELERPVIGATSKISSLQLARQAVKKKQFDIAKIHFDAGVQMDDFPIRIRKKCPLPPNKLVLSSIDLQGQLKF